MLEYLNICSFIIRRHVQGLCNDVILIYVRNVQHLYGLCGGLAKAKIPLQGTRISSLTLSKLSHKNTKFPYITTKPVIDIEIQFCFWFFLITNVEYSSKINYFSFRRR
jgi:hypothetical protein